VAVSQTFCNTATVSSLVASGENIQWYSEAAGGTGLTLDMPLTSGNYYVSQTVNGVESDRALITVKINDLPSAAIASANSQPNCTNTFGSILITAPLGTGYTYSADGLTYSSTTKFSPLTLLW
jgi:hypothetical protein